MLLPNAPDWEGDTDHPRYDRCDGACVMCRRPVRTASGWAVRLDAGLSVIIPPDAEVGDDGGWFPVGSHCAKKIPLALRLKGAL